MFVRIAITLFFLNFSISGILANTIRIELFHGFSIKTFMISPIEGKYELQTSQGELIRLKKNTVVYFSVLEKNIKVWDNDQTYGTYAWVKLIESAATKNNIFKIETTFPALAARIYEGQLEISTNQNALKLINSVGIDSYLAGVVEAESGPNAPYEFYKAQAIISRTYLLDQILRQGPAKYTLSDDVYHQVYKGMNTKNPLILQAVMHTSGLVIVDTLNQMITATFHSNSGGFTANSEDVWLKETPYLKAKDDPFSLGQRNTIWQDTILVEDWIEYLKKNGFDIEDDQAKIDNLYFEQTNRRKFYMYKNDTLSLRKIREDLGLRSTWFSFEPEGNYLIISGKGYGHGVGLSQEGAIQMARLNYSFIDIITYYYKNIKIVHADTLLANPIH